MSPVRVHTHTQFRGNEPTHMQTDKERDSIHLATPTLWHFCFFCVNKPCKSLAAKASSKLKSTLLTVHDLALSYYMLLISVNHTTPLVCCVPWIYAYPWFLNSCRWHVDMLPNNSVIKPAVESFTRLSLGGRHLLPIHSPTMLRQMSFHFDSGSAWHFYLFKQSFPSILLPSASLCDFFKNVAQG